MKDVEIQKWIELNMFHPDGTPMIDTQTFYEGAKWFRNTYLSEIEKELNRRLQIIETETDDFTRELMISNITAGLID